MTVSQLIEELKDMPQDAEVVYPVNGDAEQVDKLFKPGNSHPWSSIPEFDGKVVLW